MADQIHIPNRLDAHHADQNIVDFVSPECDAGRQFGFEFAARHVGLMPTILRYHAAVGVGRGVDDLQYHRVLVAAAGANHGQSGCLTC